MTVRVIFFSGTGCTAHVAGVFKREIEARGHTVQVHELRHDTSRPNGPYDRLILCFAVHAANAPHPVMQWAARLHPVKEVPAAVISVSGGGEVTPNLACRVAIKRRLRCKGFRIQYEKMLTMPSNWIVATKPALAARLLEVLPGKTARIIEEFLSGTVRKNCPGPGNRLLSLFGKLETFGARFFGERIRVNEICTGCGLCVRRCPVGNITLKNGRPVFGKDCIMCLNCIYSCPRQALHPGIMKFVTIKEGFDLERIKASLPWKVDIDIEKEAAGFLWLGVRRYLLENSDISETPASRS